MKCVTVRLGRGTVASVQMRQSTATVIHEFKHTTLITARAKCRITLCLGKTYRIYFRCWRTWTKVSWVTEKGSSKKMAGTVQNPKISIGNKIQTLNRIQDNISVNH